MATQTALALPMTGSVTLVSAQPLSERLEALVLVAEDKSFGDLPVITAGEREEVEGEMDRLRIALAPCGDPEEVNTLLGTLSSAYPAGKLSTGEARMQNHVYCEALKDIPLDVLKVAFRRAVKEFKFFPTVAEIRSLAQVVRRKRGARFNRLKLIAYRFDLVNGTAAKS